MTTPDPVSALMALADRYADDLSNDALGRENRHESARAALRAAIEEAVAWRPIAEAPKDGTPVLLFGTWAGEINGIADDPDIGIGYWTDGRSDYSGTDWWNLTGGDAYSTWMRPVCWRPLPAPPADAALKRGE